MLSSLQSDKAGEAFQLYWSNTFPWTKNVKNDSEAKVQEAMKKWTSMGPVAFQAMQANPLHTRAKQMQAPDEFKQALKEKARRKK